MMVQQAPVTCQCGGAMRTLIDNLYLCPSCGRMRWGDQRVSPAVVLLIIALTIVLLLVLRSVGHEGAQYR